MDRENGHKKKPVVIETTGFSSGPIINDGLAQTIEFSTAPGMHVYFRFLYCLLNTILGYSLSSNEALIEDLIALPFITGNTSMCPILRRRSGKGM